MMKKRRMGLFLIMFVVAMTFCFDAQADESFAGSKIKRPGKTTITGVQAKKTSINVKWKKAKRATHYKVYVNGKAVKKTKKISCTIKNLKPGKSYRIKVRPVKAYKATKWYNKKTHKWTFKKPKKAIRGKSKRVTRYIFGKSSKTVLAKTKKIKERDKEPELNADIPYDASVPSAENATLTVKNEAGGLRVSITPISKADGYLFYKWDNNKDVNKLYKIQTSPSMLDRNVVTGEKYQYYVCAYKVINGKKRHGHGKWSKFVERKFEQGNNDDTENSGGGGSETDPTGSDEFYGYETSLQTPSISVTEKTNGIIVKAHTSENVDGYVFCRYSGTFSEIEESIRISKQSSPILIDKDITIGKYYSYGVYTYTDSRKPGAVSSMATSRYICSTGENWKEITPSPVKGTYRITGKKEIIEAGEQSRSIKYWYLINGERVQQDDDFFKAIANESTLIFTEDSTEVKLSGSSNIRKGDDAYYLEEIISSNDEIIQGYGRQMIPLTKGTVDLTMVLKCYKNNKTIQYHYTAVSEYENPDLADYIKFRKNWISGNITAGMSTLDKVKAIGQFVGRQAGYSYNATGGHQGWILYKYKRGSCMGFTGQAHDFCRDLGIACEEVAPVSAPNHRDLLFVDDEGTIRVLYCTDGYAMYSYASADDLKKDYVVKEMF